ncbi:MAG: CopG family transcriptional regulator [Thermoplasmatales archaeon]|nr:MAG: CopG family transcriptional regulator [Thermoplasmatales archaeon]
MTDHNENIKTVYIDQKTLGLLDAVAKNFSISRSALIRILINQYCKDKSNFFRTIEKQVDIITQKGGD